MGGLCSQGFSAQPGSPPGMCWTAIVRFLAGFKCAASVFVLKAASPEMETPEHKGPQDTTGWRILRSDAPCLGIFCFVWLPSAIRWLRCRGQPCWLFFHELGCRVGDGFLPAFLHLNVNVAPGRRKVSSTLCLEHGSMSMFSLRRMRALAHNFFHQPTVRQRSASSWRVC